MLGNTVDVPQANSYLCIRITILLIIATITALVRVTHSCFLYSTTIKIPFSANLRFKPEMKKHRPLLKHKSYPYVQLTTITGSSYLITSGKLLF